jgi:hypothetical protein
VHLRRPIAAWLMILLLAGCGARDHPGDGNQQPGSQAPSATSSTGSDGIGAGEAKARGVFVATYDAKLDAIPTPESNGQTTVTLSNVGREDDSYYVTIDPPDAGKVRPATVHVATGQKVRLSLHVTGSGTVRVMSRGRGAEVAAQPIG